MCKQALAFVVVVSAVVQALPVRAAGTITGLTLSLPAIKTCVVDTVTVNGTGQCATFSVSFWRRPETPRAAASSQSYKIPGHVSSHYSKLGTYKVEADGGSTSPRSSETCRSLRPLDRVDVHLGLLLLV